MTNPPFPMDLIIDLISSGIYGSIASEEDVLQYIKETMARQAILKQYGDKIKQLPPTEKNGVVKPGRFYVRLNGRLIYKTTRKDIEDVLVTHYLKDIPKTRTLTTTYEEWKELRKHEASKNTRSKDKHLWDKFFEGSPIATIPLADLDRVTLKKWAYDVIERNSLKKKYFYNVASLLNSILDYAVDRNYISTNPYRGIALKGKVFSAPTEKDEFDDVFTKPEQKVVMQEAELDSVETHSALPLGICILFLTGIRDGELCALKYKDISKNQLHIQRMLITKQKEDANGNFHSNGYEVVPHTKTDAGNRFIPLTKQAMAYFERIKKLNQDSGYDTSPEAYIFMRSKKELSNPRVFDSRLRKYCRKADMTVIKSPHDIRRTYITCLIDNGVNLEKVRRLAGHATIEMTMKYVRNRDTDTTELLERVLRL